MAWSFLVYIYTTVYQNISIVYQFESLVWTAVSVVNCLYKPANNNGCENEMEIEETLIMNYLFKSIHSL